MTKKSEIDDDYSIVIPPPVPSSKKRKEKKEHVYVDEETLAHLGLGHEEAFSGDDTEKKENFLEIIEEKEYNDLDDIVLSNNSICIRTPVCDIYVSYEELRIEDLFVLLIRKKEGSDFFRIAPSKLAIVYVDVSGEKRMMSVVYTGISFDYNSKSFLVFHKT